MNLILIRTKNLGSIKLRLYLEKISYNLTKKLLPSDVRTFTENFRSEILKTNLNKELGELPLNIVLIAINFKEAFSNIGQKSTILCNLFIYLEARTFKLIVILIYFIVTGENSSLRF